MLFATLSTRARMLLIVWAAMMMACALALVAAPATARSWPSLYHYAPDDGYDQPILVYCNALAYEYLIAEGQSTPGGCGGFSRIFVRDNEEIWCKYNTAWYKQWDATGWHKPAEGWVDGLGCTVRTD